MTFVKNQLLAALLLASTALPSMARAEEPAEPAAEPALPDAPAADPVPETPATPDAVPAAGLGTAVTNAAAAAVDRKADEEAWVVKSDHVLLHTVQKKEYADGGRHEFVLYPAAIQINQKFTTHMGVSAQYAYHLHENFAFQIQGAYFYINEQTGFTEELIVNGKQAPQAATALTLQWDATGGFEMTPIYGKFSLFEGTMGHFGLVLSAGAGLAGTRIQIQNESSAGGERTFGDTGQKFVGQVGAGFRIFLTEYVLLRLEVKDLVYTAKVDTINGCDVNDLEQLKNGLPALSGSCANGDFADSSDYAIAKTLVEDPSSDVLNNVGFYAGVAVAF